MDQQILRAVNEVVRNCQGKVYRAEKYLSDKLVVRACVRRYKGKIVKNRRDVEILLTIGRPNFKEREFIKVCKKAKELFPVKKVQLTSVK